MLEIIGFKELRISCIIGNNLHERDLEQEIIVDFKAEVDFSTVYQSGLIEDTVDYTLLAEICISQAKKGRYYLIENYAIDSVQKVLTIPLVKSAWILVKKPLALKEAKYAFVEYKGEN